MQLSNIWDGAEWELDMSEIVAWNCINRVTPTDLTYEFILDLQWHFEYWVLIKLEVESWSGVLSDMLPVWVICRLECSVWVIFSLTKELSYSLMLIFFFSPAVAARVLLVSMVM